MATPTQTVIAHALAARASERHPESHRASETELLERDILQRIADGKSQIVVLERVDSDTLEVQRHVGLLDDDRDPFECDWSELERHIPADFVPDTEPMP